MLLEPVLISSVAGLVVAMLSFPLIRLAAQRLGLTDRPDSHRKLHGRPIPLGGGVCVGLGMVAGIAAASIWDPVDGPLSQTSTQPIWAMIGASCLIIVLGLIDDRFGLRGRHKLVGQVLIAVLLSCFGYHVQTVQAFGWHVELGLFAWPFTIGWFVLAINAINLIDGIDGLATSVGAILSIALCWVATLGGHPTEAMVLAGLAGGLLGFLPFNFPPAKMFLGDTGSMLIGLVLGAMAIRGSLKGPATVALAAPLAVWTIPLLDTTAAILRRKLTGRSIYTTDRGHIHHCLQQLSGSTRRTLYWVVLACGGSCVGALLSVYLKNDSLALISALAVVSVLVISRAFGYGELMLLAGRIRSLMNPFSAGGITPAQQHAVRLQGSKPWEVLWESLLDVTDDFNLAQASLDVNIPASHEGYHVTWKRPSAGEDLELWHADVPIYCDNRFLGRVCFAGPHNGFSACETVIGLMEFVLKFEDDFRVLVQQGQPAAPGDATAADQTAPSAPSKHSLPVDSAQLSASLPVAHSTFE